MAGLFKNELTCTIQDGLSNGCSWHKADSDHRSYDYFLTSFVTCPSEALSLMLEYIADNERLPFKQTLLSDEDAELVEIVKERLRNPKPVRVTLDEL